VLSVVDPYLHEIFPGGAEAARALPHVPETYAVVADVRRIQDALGVESLILLRGAGHEATLLLTAPRSLILGSLCLADAGRSLGIFHAACACARIAGCASLGQALPSEKGLSMVEAITTQSDIPGMREMRKRVERALSRKAKKELEQVMNAGGDAQREWPAWEEEERKRAMYIGVLFCRDLREIACVLAPEAMLAEGLAERKRGLAASASMCDALKFITSDACWTAHRWLYGRG
jgi:hypothetical protein